MPWWIYPLAYFVGGLVTVYLRGRLFQKVRATGGTVAKDQDASAMVWGVFFLWFAAIVPTVYSLGQVPKAKQ